MQSTGAQTLVVGSTGVKKIRGVHLSYISLARRRFLLPLCFARLKPPPLALVLAPPLASAPPPLAAARLHVEPPPPRPRARPAPPVRACAAACAHRRRRLLFSPAPPAQASIAKAPPCSTPQPHDAAAAPRRSRTRSIFSAGARQVLDDLPGLLLSRRVRVPHTVSRDGSREEEGEGSCGREARSQADSCREGGREGRDGGQGRRGAGIRPCSSVPDQGGPQRQRQRQGYGQSQRCQGHQSRDSSSSSDRFRWF